MLKLQKAEEVLLFLTLLFLPTQLGKHFWPSFSFIYSLKIDYLSLVVYFWDLLVVALVSVWLIRKPYINKPALNIMLFFLLTQALSLLTANNTGAGLVRAEQYLIAGSFGVFLASQSFAVLQKKLYLPLILGILGESLLAVWQFAKGSTAGLWLLGERAFNISTPGIAKFDYYGKEFLRPYATFPHPNMLAGYLLVIICFLWLVLNIKKISKDKMVLKAAAVLAGFAVLLSMSRAVILGSLIMLFIFFRKKAFIGLTIVVLILFPVLFTRFSSVLNYDNLTILRRMEMSKTAIEVFSKSPLIGVGLNNFIPVSAAGLTTGPTRFLQPVHNLLLLILVETGILGLVGWVFLIGWPIKKIISYQLPVTIFLPLFIVFFLGLFDHYWLTLPQGYRLLFIIWGVFFSMLEWLKHAKSNPSF